jgi:hypothetical protein
MRRWVFLLLAAGGIAVGHTVTYALLPGHEHAGALAHTHLQEFGAAAAVSLLALLLWSTAREVRGHSSRIPSRWLVVAQVSGFAALEAVEAAGASHLSGALDEPAVWFGLALQVLLATVLRRGFERVPQLLAAAVLGLAPAPVPTPALRPHTIFDFALAGGIAGAANGSRAPPAG